MYSKLLNNREFLQVLDKKGGHLFYFKKGIYMRRDIQKRASQLGSYPSLIPIGLSYVLSV